MRIELEVAGYDVQFVSINKIDAVTSQEEIVKHCAFPQLQDTEALALWDRLDGGKDDFYILDAEGKLRTYLPFSGGEVSTNLAEPDDYAAVKAAIMAVIEGEASGFEPPKTREEDTGVRPDVEAAPEDVGPAPEDTEDAGETDASDEDSASEDASAEVD